MARFVALSSFVSRGHVGLRAIVPALESFGHDVIALPTVVLSSHAAYPHVAGTPIDTELLDHMAEAVEANDWLAGIDVIVTGYLPSPAHVTFAARLVRRIRTQNRAALFVCDPVLGDAPKGLYVPKETAVSVKSELLPLADILTPNAFELSWLTGLPVTGLNDGLKAASALADPTVLATSIPAPDRHLATLLHSSTGTIFTSVPWRAKTPSGTGDLLTGLFAGAIGAGIDPQQALAQSGARLEEILTYSGISDEVVLTPLFQRATHLTPLSVAAAT